VGTFHFGKATKVQAHEQHWVTAKHYAHCTVHIARRIWGALEEDRAKWMGTPTHWPSMDSSFPYGEGPHAAAQRLTGLLCNNARAVSAAIDVMNRYKQQPRIRRRVGDQIRLIHHRFRWIDAKPPGQFSPEIREAFYAILDAYEYGAAYEYLRAVSAVRDADYAYDGPSR
jgi:hypothetical protein